jgi:hypothetical protein
VDLTELHYGMVSVGLFCVHGGETSDSVNAVGCLLLFGWLSATHSLCSIGVAVRFIFCEGRYCCVPSRFLCSANLAVILLDSSLKVTKFILSYMSCVAYCMSYVINSKYCCLSQHLHTSQPHLELSQSRKATRRHCSVM